MANSVAKVAIISKTVTSNLGNQVLTTALADIAREVTNGTSVIIGRPQGLGALHIREASTWSSAALNRWIDRSVSLCRLAANHSTMQDLESERIRIVAPSGRRRPRFVRTARSVAKKVASRMALPEARFVRRLLSLRECSRVLYSGAGEVGDYAPFVREVVELCAVKRLSPSQKIWLTNCSVVVTEPWALDALRMLIPVLEGAVVRGARSARRLVELGMEEKRVHIAPDTSFCAINYAEASGGDRSVPGARRRTVVVVVNGMGAAGSLGEWESILRGLKQEEFERIILTSTDLLLDLPVLKQLQRSVGAELVSDCLDFRAYMKLVGQAELVISERMHAGVMAVAAGVPTIFVERGVHKTTEQLELVSYPIAPIDPQIAGWPRRLLELVRSNEHVKHAPGLQRIVRDASSRAEANVRVPLTESGAP